LGIKSGLTDFLQGEEIEREKLLPVRLYFLIGLVTKSDKNTG
jgi:hypothetical protein